MPNPLPSSLALDQAMLEAAAARWQGLAKPPGALGVLEDIGTTLCGIAGQCPPPIPASPAVAVFAGDHGVTAEGASAWPSEVTMAMVATMCSGEAAINAIARSIGAPVTVVDVGVDGDLSDVPGLVHRKVRRGTGNIAVEPAMTLDEAHAAVEVGRGIAEQLIADGADCLIGGEMGIGNTTPSAAIVGLLSFLDAEEITGPGAGQTVEGLAHKKELVTQAITRAGMIDDPFEILAAIGGLEIGALAGFYIGAAERRVPFIVDGAIAGAAACLADRMVPGLGRMVLAGHRSAEAAGPIAADLLGARPILDLWMRLGEGTGAALAYPVVTAAARTLNEMAELPTP
jgi:nicotinate-nucleotide--dimethylbenzimidazole phosphoribosyltransferase